VVDGFRPLFGGLEIRGGVDVKADNLRVRAFRDEPPLQELAEQVVVAIPLLIQTIGEEAPVFELGQLAPAIVDTGEAFSDLRRDLLKDRGGEQEVACLLRLLVQDLFGEEIEQVAVGRCGDRLDEFASLLRRRALAQRDLNQLERCRPTLGPALELRDIGRIERIVVNVPEDSSISDSVKRSASVLSSA